MVKPISFLFKNTKSFDKVGTVRLLKIAYSIFKYGYILSIYGIIYIV